MKHNFLSCAFVLLLAVVVQLYAQQTEEDRRGLELLKAQAESGNAKAQCVLGDFYTSGVVVPKDSTQAVSWYRKAAELGDAKAQYNLSLHYRDGDGVTKDLAETAKWCRKSADQGYPDAQSLLGLSYQLGFGVTTNAVEAAKWYKRAADQGHPAAQRSLGFCYGRGLGVSRDYVEAYKWLTLVSATSHDNYTKDALAALETELTSEQISKARRMAREFKPQKETGSSFYVSPESMNGPKTSGSGVFITEDGFLVTNEHVVRGAAQIRLITKDGFCTPKVVRVDAANDLALLKAEGKFAALPVVSSRGARLGATVATVGFPNTSLRRFAPKLAKGEIASLSGAGDDARYFQISVPVQSGNSGGALVDERGNVVGVVSAKLSAKAALAASGSLPENVNYAVKSSYLLSFLESVPEVSAKLKEPETKERKFEDVVKSAEQAAVLVLVY